jgi:fructose-1,6-bisphosphatase/inositol monophosphatase family enzyme
MVNHLDSRGTKAGEVTTSELGISVKENAADFATAIDLENEIAVLERLKKDFPSHSHPRHHGKEKTFARFRCLL